MDIRAGVNAAPEAVSDSSPDTGPTPDAGAAVNGPRPVEAPSGAPAPVVPLDDDAFEATPREGDLILDVSPKGVVSGRVPIPAAFLDAAGSGAYTVRTTERARLHGPASGRPADRAARGALPLLFGASKDVRAGLQPAARVVYEDGLGAMARVDVWFRVATIRATRLRVTGEEADVAPGRSGRVMLSVANAGNLPSRVRIEVAEPRGLATQAPEAVDLDPGESEELSVRISVPEGAVSGISGLRFRAISEGDTATATAYVRVRSRGADAQRAGRASIEVFAGAFDDGRDLPEPVVMLVSSVGLPADRSLSLRVRAGGRAAHPAISRDVAGAGIRLTYQGPRLRMSAGDVYGEWSPLSGVVVDGSGLDVSTDSEPWRSRLILAADDGRSGGVDLSASRDIGTVRLGARGVAARQRETGSWQARQATLLARWQRTPASEATLEVGAAMGSVVTATVPGAAAHISVRDGGSGWAVRGSATRIADGADIGRSAEERAHTVVSLTPLRGVSLNAAFSRDVMDVREGRSEGASGTVGASLGTETLALGVGALRSGQTVISHAADTISLYRREALTLRASGRLGSLRWVGLGENGVERRTAGDQPFLRLRATASLNGPMGWLNLGVRRERQGPEWSGLTLDLSAAETRGDVTLEGRVSHTLGERQVPSGWVALRADVGASNVTLGLERRLAGVGPWRLAVGVRRSLAVGAPIPDRLLYREGLVWEDLDGDGTRGADEPGVAQVDVMFDGERITSDMDGRFRVPRGVRTTDVYPDPATVPPGLAVVAGTDPLRVALVRYGRIHVTAYHDWNGNGSRDPGEEAASAATIRIRGGAGANVRQATVDEAGRAEFTAVMPGVWQVESLRASSAPNPSTYAIDPVRLEPGDTVEISIPVPPKAKAVRIFSPDGA